MHAIKRIAGLIVGAIVVLMILMFVFRQPETAGHTVTGFFGWLGNAGDALGQFFNTL